MSSARLLARDSFVRYTRRVDHCEDTMFEDHPKVSPEVIRLLKRVIKRQMAPLKILRINVDGRDDGWVGAQPFEKS